MMSLFSSFDYIFFYKNIVLTFSFFIYINTFTFIKGKFLFFKEFILSMLESFFLSLKEKSFNKFSIMMFVSMFLFLFYINFTSVFSYNFALTSQFGPVMFFALMTWMSLIIFSMISNGKGFISHFTPEGTPMYLVPLLFLIEIISNLIRPITLTVRLVANILAGHLLMILLSKMVMTMNIFLSLYMILNIVEIFVSIIQSYIFITMTILYFSEV